MYGGGVCEKLFIVEIVCGSVVRGSGIRVRVYVERVASVGD